MASRAAWTATVMGVFVLGLSGCGAGSGAGSGSGTSSGSGTGSGSGAGQGSAAVAGVVLAGPNCPVERPGTPCPDVPVAGARVEVLAQGAVVAHTQADQKGAFRIALEPGGYVVRATNVGGYASQASQQVQLTGGQTVTVTLTVDTGIR